MLTKNIKFPYLKLTFDIIGILSFVGILVIISLNFYVNTNGDFNAGVNVIGTDMILMNILVLTTVISAFVSYLLRKIK